VVPRLQDMGVEPYQLAAAFKGAAAQRLVRRLCPACAHRRPPNDAEFRFAELCSVSRFEVAFDPVGCPECHGSGFKNRIAIAEAFLASDDFLRGVVERKSVSDMAAMAKAGGLSAMARDGLDKVAAGFTTVEEVMAAVHG